MSGAKVAEALERVIDGEGAVPESITCDNGSEFAGRPAMRAKRSCELPGKSESLY